MTSRNWLIAAIVVVGAIAIYGAVKPTPAPAPAPTTTTSTSTTVPSPAVAGDPCAALDAAVTGAVIQLDGAAPDAGCDTHPKATLVTVTGGWTGDVVCHLCNGWVFSGVSVSAGSLKMVGGQGWRIEGGTFDGGNRGRNESLGVGSTDESGTAADQPTDWVIDGVTVRNTGCKAADSAGNNQARSLYVIGKNGSAMRGVIENSTFTGSSCGATVKIGGTGFQGSSTSSPDAADQVKFLHNTVTNPAGAVQPDGVLVATNSDDITIDGNTIHVAGNAVTPSGPYSGVRLAITNNKIQAAKFVQAQVWTYPALGVLGQGGTTFISVVKVGPCPSTIGFCSGNTVG